MLYTLDADSNDKYGTFKVGTHDALVIALGLCVVYSPGPSRRAWVPML